jgi:hypothetical protein
MQNLNRDRSIVEHEDNIDKMVVIDAETSEYAVDRSSIHIEVEIIDRMTNTLYIST